MFNVLFSLDLPGNDTSKTFGGRAISRPSYRILKYYYLRMKLSVTMLAKQ